MTISGSSKKRVTCSLLSLLLFLCFIGVLLFLSILITYFITKDHVQSMYDTSMSGNASSISITNGNETIPSMISTDDESTILDDEDHTGPTPEELRLSKALEPLWYNMTMRVNVPGFVPIPPEKNLTFSAALIIKLLVREATNKIELNAVNLNLSNDTDDYSILIEGLKVRIKIIN